MTWNPIPGDPGTLTTGAVTRYLQDIRFITGTTEEEQLVLNGLVALCAFSHASGHDMPQVVKRLLEVLSEETRSRAASTGG